MGKYQQEHDSAFQDLSALEGGIYDPGQFDATQFDLTQFDIVTVNTGHFKVEHDSALADEAAATGFSVESSQALRDVGDAGA